MATQTREIGPLTTRAEVQKVDVPSRRVDLVWSAGATVRRYDWDVGPYNEALSMDPRHVRMGRLSSGSAPLLADHRASVASVLGVVERARIDGGKGHATVRFAAEGVDPIADQVFAKVRDGVIKNVSVGYRVYKFQEDNSDKAKIPTRTAVDWEPHEVSAVAIGADAGAGFRESVPLNVCEFTQARASGVGSNTQSPRSHMSVNGNHHPSNDNPDLDSARAEGAATERDRAIAIREMCRGFNVSEGFPQKLIDAGVSVAEARGLTMDEIRSRQAKISGVHTAGIEVGVTDGEKRAQGMEAAILNRFGFTRAHGEAVRASQSETVREVFKGHDFDETGGEFRSMGIPDMAKHHLDSIGVNTRGLNRDRVTGTALAHRGGGWLDRRSAGSVTISDLPTILENAMHKLLLGSYAIVADSWREFCGIDATTDFRPANRYLLGSFGALDRVMEGAEFRQKGVPDGQRFTIQAVTFGNLISVSRQALVNDDLAGISSLLASAGRSAALSIEKAVYALLAQNAGLGPILNDGRPLFHSSRGNVSDPGTPISMAAIEADRVLMRKQKDLNSNEYLDLRPHVLLVPTEIGGVARKVNESKYDPTAGSAFESPNIVAGLFNKIIDSPRVSDISVSRRYMFADPAQAAAIVVAFLNGMDAPFMEQRLGWSVDGTEVKIRIDFGVQAMDPRAAVTNAGA